MTYNLPEWIIPLIPELKNPARISFNNGKYSVTNPDGNPAGTFDTDVEAYDFCEERDWDQKFDSSVPRSEKLGRVVFSDHRGRGGFRRMLISRTDEDRVALLENTYAQWRETEDRYYAEPGNFMNAYMFVTAHPAFWTRYNNQPTFHWDTGSYAEKVWMHPSVKDDGSVYWMMEAGEHTSDYMDHYHNFKLDVYADTVEEGFIQLAAKVAKFFHDDGTARENVEYEKSQIELDLDEAVEELDDWYRSKGDEENTS